jgi:hypothetical protein
LWPFSETNAAAMRTLDAFDVGALVVQCHASALLYQLAASKSSFAFDERPFSFDEAVSRDAEAALIKR